MSQTHGEYLVVDEVFDVPVGLSIFGRAPHPDTPWPQPGEAVELHAPDGSTLQVLVLEIDEQMALVAGGNPATRAFLIPRHSVQSLLLQGFRVTGCRNPSSVMLKQQSDFQAAADQSRRRPIALLWLLVGLMAIAAVAAVVYALR